MPNYTTPVTAIVGQPLPAADWNAGVRDSLEDVGKPKRCKVSRNTSFAVPNAVVTTIPWTTEEFDPDNMWAAGAPNNIVIPRSGIWSVTISCQFALNGTGGRHVAIMQEGIIKGAWNMAANASWYLGQSLTAILNCVSNDTITFTAYQNSGAALNLDIVYPITASVYQISR